MRDQILKKLAFVHAKHPWWMLLLVIVLTIIFGKMAGQLTMTMRTSDLLPEGDEKVVQFNQIVDEFATASNLVIVVQGEERRIKAFADELAPVILSLKDTTQNEKLKEQIDVLVAERTELREKSGEAAEIAEIEQRINELQRRINFPLFQRVDYKSEVEFLRNHALLLVKAEDLKNTKEMFTNPNLTEFVTNLNNSLEKEYVQREESISTREKEDGAVSFLNGIQNFVENLSQAVDGSIPDENVRETADKLLLGEPYMLSYDNTALVMLGIPNFTIMDRDLLMVAAETVQVEVDRLLEKYPDVSAGLSGSIAREHDEQVYSEQSLNYSTLIALVVILILLIISFKMWVAPVFALMTLIVGVIWALGVSWAIVRQLNMMTSMMSVILLGLGIDFAIHVISGFTERRAAGDSIALALEKTFLQSAKGIITGALTTACAFLTLMISQAAGMREMGIVVGGGLVSILAVTLLLLPVFLVLREQFIEKKRTKKPQQFTFQRRDISFKALERISAWLGRRYVFTLLAAIFLTVFLVLSAMNISFDHNYMNIEPEGLTSIALMDTVLEKFDLSLENALILADGVEESRKFAKQCRDLGSVGLTDDISVYLPSTGEQQERIPLLLEIRDKISQTPIRSQISAEALPKLIQEIERLEMNIIEMQDLAFIGGQDKVDRKCMEIVGDPENPDSESLFPDLIARLPKGLPGLSKFQQTFAPYFKAKVLKMSNIEPIELTDLPVSILDRYANKQREQFLVSVYPSGNLWEDKALLDRFVDDIDRISEKATGTPPLMVSLLRIFARDGRNAILLTLVIVFLLLWFDFRSPLLALISMLPLAAGFFWMLGLMNLFGMQLNIVNVIGLPLIIGIGIDDGVHIMHRWKHEGKGSLQLVFSSTGKAILLTSMTTMFAFGSLGFSIFRGWASFGMALFLGVGACFLTTVLVLPGVLGLLEQKKRNI